MYGWLADGEAVEMYRIEFVILIFIHFPTRKMLFYMNNFVFIISAVTIPVFITNRCWYRVADPGISSQSSLFNH